MPTVTARDVDVAQREAAARVAIAEALVGLTPIQAVHLLATLLAEHTQRLEAREARELDAEPEQCADCGEVILGAHGACTAAGGDEP